MNNEETLCNLLLAFCLMCGRGAQPDKTYQQKATMFLLISKNYQRNVFCHTVLAQHTAPVFLHVYFKLHKPFITEDYFPVHIITCYILNVFLSYMHIVWQSTCTD